MKKNRIMIIVLLVVLSLKGFVFAQSNNNRGILFLAVSHPSEKTGFGFLDIYIKMPYSKLQFVKKSNSFQASYDLSVEISSKESAKIERKFWREEISTIDFLETSSDKIFMHSQTKVELLPGTYNILLEITSLNSSQNFSLQKTAEIKAFWENELVISEPVFINYTEMESNNFEILADKENITTDYSGGIGIFFKIFNKSKKDFNLKWRVSSFYSSELELFADDILVPSTDLIMEKYLPLDKNLLYSGPYIVVITAEQNGSIYETEKKFNLMWLDKPINLDNIDELLDQMRHILHKDTFEVVRRKSPDGKKAYFQDFWRIRDPEPNTKNNELMIEYFRRIDYVNQNFSHSKAIGRKSDRGRIYIVYGEPSRRIILYNEPGKPPFEIWIYSQINRKFLFVDKYRTGEFLQTPFTREYNLDHYYY